MSHFIPREGNGDGSSKATPEGDGVMHFLGPILPLGALLGGTEQRTNVSMFKQPLPGCLSGAKRHRAEIRFRRRGKAGPWAVVRYQPVVMVCPGALVVQPPEGCQR